MNVKEVVLKDVLFTLINQIVLNVIVVISQFKFIVVNILYALITKTLLLIVQNMIQQAVYKE